MKFTLGWLKEHLETDATLDEIVEALTMIGLEVEEIDDRSDFNAFKIAKVLSAKQHPDADRLQVLSVDTGEGEPQQVVCGAPNAREGLVGVLGKPGDYVPGLDITLSVGKIRGVESFGMMCSERELNMSDEHDGIIDLPQDAPIGTSFADYAGLSDPIIEIGITPNRPDALGVAGIARDLAAYGIGKVKPVEIKPISSSDSCPVDVKIEDDEFCPAFGLSLVRGVKNGASPKWMQQRLRAIGLRPISALVDITNYVTFDLGRPLHVFDADKVKGNLKIRRAENGETFLGLDDKEYTLKSDHYVIADDNGAESLAGIMGGAASGVDESTTNVLVESALWEPLKIARTGRDLGIITDARYRFERGVDPAMMVDGLHHAVALVKELCGGSETAPIISGKVPEPSLVLDFPTSEVNRLTGISVNDDAIENILTRLGFEIESKSKNWKVKVPSWRPDVFGKADLVEEVMRIHGVNNIEPQPLPALSAIGSKILTTSQIRARNARRGLASRGMLEAVTYSFISKEQAECFGGGDKSLALANPIAADLSDMRPSLLPNLIAASQRNSDRGFNDVAMFEVAHVYLSDNPDDQHRVAGGIRRGTAGTVTGGGRAWQGNAAKVSVFDAKADALAVLEACGMDASNAQLVAGGPSWYHPGRVGTLQLGPKLILGYFGELHPHALEVMDSAGPVVGFEIYLDRLPVKKAKATKTKPPLEISNLQAVRRDFAFVMDSDVEAAKILRAANGADKKAIVGVNIFDIFEGESLGEGKKSVAFEVTIQPWEKTLTDEEIEAISSKIIAAVEKTTGGQLRG
jgi:phenylalanyl-tRNA synthetase beta chain